MNFDALIGPTHHFGGLSRDNIASQENKETTSKPKEAALQGLYKMKMLSDMGIDQGVLPPHERPNIRALRELGFMGADEQVIKEAFESAPDLASACYSASGAWSANMATVSPSSETADGRVHFTPANLLSQFHRSLETYTSSCILMGLFPHPDTFVHHDPIPYFGDEGSANQLRLNKRRIFVYGGRQTLEASQANARLHRIKDPIFIEQHPEAIQAGIFHNDLVAVAHKNVLIYHEKAWVRPLDELDINAILITEKALTLQECVETYLLNSQLVSTDQEMILIAPKECQQHPRAQAVITQILDGNNPITKALYFDLSESMKNGGGPACLRLEVPLTDVEKQSMNRSAILTDILYHTLVDWINDHYRDTLSLDDLRDPHLLQESRTALDELTEILDLGPLYPFQQG